MVRRNKNIFKSLGRNIVFPAIVSCNIDKLIRNRSNKNILNVMFHGVFKENGAHFRASHTPVSLFKKQIQYLAKNFNIITIPEAFEHYRNSTAPNKPSVTISFDDGFKNNLDTALPILEQYKAPAVFFVSGVCTEKRPIQTLWTVILNAMNYYYGQYNIENLNENGIKTKTELIKLLQSNGRAVEIFVKRALEQYDLAERLNKTPKEGWQLMNSEDIQQLQSSEYALIGSHAYTHLKLAEINQSDLSFELNESAKKLKNVTGKNIDMIAFPYGSYNCATKDAAFEAGYTMQLAVDYQCKTDKADKQILNRYGLPINTTFASSAFFISKAFADRGIKLTNKL